MPRPDAPGLSASNAAPLYLQVRRELVSALARGEWKVGERLPTEPELAERWGVAISTVRAGIAQLVAAGVLSRRQGRGTFVAPLDSSAGALRFSNVYDASRRKVTTVRDITRMRKVRGDRAVRRELALGDDAWVWHLEGLLHVDGAVAATIEVHLPADRCATLKVADITPTHNLYAIYQRCCGVTVLRMEERVHARNADEATARKLGLEPGAALLCTERTAYTFDDVPVELRRRCFDGARYHYLFMQDGID